MRAPVAPTAFATRNSARYPRAALLCRFDIAYDQNSRTVGPTVKRSSPVRRGGSLTMQRPYRPSPAPAAMMSGMAWCELCDLDDSTCVHGYERKRSERERTTALRVSGRGKAHFDGCPHK